MKLTSLSLVTGIAVSGIVASGAFTPAQAVGTGVLLTTEAGYTGLKIDLSEYKTGANNYTTGPQDIKYTNALKDNTITFTSTFPDGSTLGQNSVDAGFYPLGSNGRIERNPVFAGLDATTGEIVFSFSAPVQQFGAFLNYNPGFSTDPTISTYSGDTFLTSYNLRTDGGSISTPDLLDTFVFRGIAEKSAVITSFRLGGSNIAAAGSANGQSSTAVPEPFTIIGTIVGGSAALRMRKKLKSTKA